MLALKKNCAWEIGSHRTPILHHNRKCTKPILTLALVWGTNGPPPWFSVNNSRETCRIATKLSAPSHLSMWHNYPQNWFSAMLDQEVMTSYVRSCSDEMSRFCDLSYLDGFRCFLCVLLDCRQHNLCLWISRIHIQLPCGQGQARFRVPWAVSVAHFSRYSSNFTGVLSLGVIV